jgi:hypothetical protein
MNVTTAAYCGTMTVSRYISTISITDADLASLPPCRSIHHLKYSTERWIRQHSLSYPASRVDLVACSPRFCQHNE